MKLKILCHNGNTVERFYDRRSRSSVTLVKDPEGNQIGDANYDGDKVSAAFSMETMIKENGGAIRS